MSMLRRFLRDQSGATAIEYGLIAAGISVAIIGVVDALGDQLEKHILRRLETISLTQASKAHAAPRLHGVARPKSAETASPPASQTNPGRPEPVTSPVTMMPLDHRHPARLLIFPTIMAFAASSDFFTMTISNRISLILVAGFVALALGTGLCRRARYSITLVRAGLVLSVTFVFFLCGWVGGGDAKLAGPRRCGSAGSISSTICSTPPDPRRCPDAGADRVP